MIKLEHILKEMTKPSNIKEGPRDKNKIVINRIFKANGVSPVKTYSSDVRGFQRTEGKGYRHERPGMVSLHRMSAEEVKDLANQMREAGVEVESVYSNVIEYNRNNTPPVHEPDNNTKTTKKATY